MTYYEIQKELEEIVKAETPDNLGMAYAKLWGMAVAHLTEEQMATLLRHRKETK
jgi:predicted transcriptional regulator